MPINFLSKCKAICVLIIIMSLIFSTMSVLPSHAQEPSTNPYLAVLPDDLLFDETTVRILPENSDFSVDLYIKSLDPAWALQNASFSLSYNWPEPILSLLNVTVDTGWAGPNIVNTSTQDKIDIFVQDHPSPEGDIPLASIDFRIIFQGQNPPQPNSNWTYLLFSDIALWGSAGPIPRGSSRDCLIEVEPFLGQFVDIVVEDMTLSKTLVWPTYSIYINATIFNRGIYTENVTLIVHANNTAVDSANITLARHESIDLTFSWNTTGFPIGMYQLWILSNKPERWVGFSHIVGYVFLAIAGDLVGPGDWPGSWPPDGKCDIRDVAIVVRLWGWNYPSPYYRPNFDINGDLKIDIKDVALVAINFGNTAT